MSWRSTATGGYAARRFGIREIPSLVLIVRRRVVGRLEGKATGNEIDRLLRTHLPA